MLKKVYQKYIAAARKLITAYSGKEPLALYLKKYFAAHKNHGARDRRVITSLCYSYFRLGKFATGDDMSEKILTGLFLSEQLHNDLLNTFKPEWNEHITNSVADKIEYLHFPVKKIFPFKQELSAAVHHQQFCESFLKQPKLFLRLRPYKQNFVVKKLQQQKIPLAIIDDECVALANGTSIDNILTADKDVVIQDYNSQQVFNFIKNFKMDRRTVTVWDCCAASGGKSILLYDVLKRNVSITVSDLRMNIMFNLHQRFTKAGIRDYNYFIADLTQPGFTLPALIPKKISQPPVSKFQVIICDAPCTGSGTWSRTPENLHHFTTDMIAEYATKQKQIVSNAIPFLQKDGLFFYITCSVFKKENEDVAQHITEQHKLQLLHMELLKGYDKKADSMFVAVFTR
jgi:16S rRNA (cytosine967-C5)-methyltransferase